jgi:hypothetical protein
MKRLGCIQPSYIPWRGFFHIIQRSDIFVFHEDIQYTKQDWRNRNKIKTRNGWTWLTVPVQKATIHDNIDEVLIANDSNWAAHHWRQIQQNYSQAPFFDKFRDFFADTYHSKWEKLTELDIYLTCEISKFLGIKTEFVRSPVLGLSGTKTDRLADMCQKVGATHYLSGPTAQGYIEEEKLQAIDVTLEYQVYEYPEYPQLYGAFEPTMSIIDMLFNLGDATPEYIFD